MLQSTKRVFTRTLQDLDQLANSDFIRRQKFDDFFVSNLKKLKSDDFRHFCKKKIR